MKKFIFITIITVITIITIISRFSTQARPHQPQDSYLTIGSSRLSIEIADTPEAWEKGLSDRKELCWDCGLLFIFDQPSRHSFWMPRMYFNIDIIWIAEDRIVDITYDAKKPTIGENFDAPKEIYSPKVPADKVLEVNSGWVGQKGIRVSDKIIISNL